LLCNLKIGWKLFNLLNTHINKSVTDLTKHKSIGISQMSSDLLRIDQALSKTDNYYRQILDRISFSHFVELIKIEDKTKSDFGINKIQITKGDLTALESMLFEQGDLGTKELFNKAFGKKSLGELLRGIVGMEREAAKAAFGEILQQQTLNSQQIRFMDAIINYISVKGMIAPSELFEPPFTDINTSGIMGVFDMEISTRIISLIEEIKERAIA
jgi:type I site-specific restriction endonuclease